MSLRHASCRYGGALIGLREETEVVRDPFVFLPFAPLRWALFFFPFVRIGRRSTCAASLPSSSFFPPTVSCFADGRCGAPLSVFCLVVLYGASTLAFSFSLFLLCASVSSLHFCSTAQACLFFFFFVISNSLYCSAYHGRAYSFYESRHYARTRAGSIG